jgi:hypothetical protein
MSDLTKLFIGFLILVNLCLISALFNMIGIVL